MFSFTALADPTRRSIVEMLAKGERTAGEIVDQFSISPPAISQHLKVLKESGLVSVRVDAQRRIYQLAPEGFSELMEWVKQIRQVWNPAQKSKKKRRKKKK